MKTLHNLGAWSLSLFLQHIYSVQVFLQHANGPRQESLILIAYTSSGGSDEPGVVMVGTMGSFFVVVMGATMKPFL